MTLEPGPPALEVALTHRAGAFTLDAAFAVGGGLAALFGRSGSGKTTLLRAIAGTLQGARGRVAVGGVPLLDTGRGLSVPPHRRRIATVYQDTRLFPHLSVRQNLLFGRFFTPRAERKGGHGRDLDAVVAMLAIGPLLARRPAGLSGGERSRVAIGRALLASPRLLLLDEPLAALDEARKAEILPYLERLRDQAGVPILYVSHSVAEVARLATTVVLIEAGRIAAQGPPEAVLRRPDLPGEEGGALLALVVTGHDEAFALTALEGPAGRLEVPRLTLPPGAPVRLRVRARDVLLASTRPTGLSARNLLEGRILALGAAGPEAVLVEVACGDAVITARVTRKSAAELGLAPGQPVFAVIKTVAFDPATAGPRPPADL